ncbi:hypothetical protein NP233_g2591 [Leucocoprinus birnbaumii]|uniref:Reverse transcriptase n=1 Tax=Leucocoprinus birnbaumii TaxID=56174 RepID=A0AAD5YYY3_9AGAR|nr:hypothetical protein NP233_g2591 [Leucocoprinus birnbaumii]
MRDNKIGIMCLQETHLNQAQTQEIMEVHHNLKIISTAPSNSQNAQGVAIAINNRITPTRDVISHVLHEGRAILAQIPWHATETLVVLAIYAPNVTNENRDFWKSLERKWTESNELPCPDIMLGDFNLTEDSIDRNNGDLDKEDAREALVSLKRKLRLIDGWRHANPHEKEYTLYHRSNGHRSRIDRIYINPELTPMAEDWQIAHPPVTSDHQLISVKLAHHNSPFIGKGRWSIPPRVVGNRKFIQKTEKLGRTAQEEIEKLHLETNTRDQVKNAQTIWQNLKEDIIKEAKKLARLPISYLERRARELDVAMKLLNSDITVGEEEKTMSLALLRDERSKVEEKQLDEKRFATAARFSLEGNTICNYWVAINKNKTPRDIVTKLERPTEDENEVSYETRSDKMAELARDHHEKIQNLDVDAEQDETNRQTEIHSAFEDSLPRLDPQAKARLAEWITRIDTECALRSASNGKAAGLDGIPYELWKTLSERHKNLKKIRRPTFDIIKTMTLTFIDIEKHSLNVNSRFHEGWMCPIHKKGPKDKVANYRPITVLNTDYKLMTKALQSKLSQAARLVINKNQAGFMKGRSIFDHIKTIQAVTEYAESTEEMNGVIVALDQEKAYDKIRHDYLWVTLRRLNIPDNFINTVKTLYNGAKTRVMINGVLSSPFMVTRGVRQGDPLSCLLFNLAIEPLAELIRTSNITGLKIPGIQRFLKTLLYADDTTVFLDCSDSYNELLSILDRWCRASGAKFNKNKTEVIPFGSEEYKAHVRETRTLQRTDTDDSTNNTRLPDDVRLNNEGELTRILGAWFGDGDTAQPWTSIQEKTEASLRQWNKGKPNLEGKRHINQMETAGRTQFLTRAQGMPKNVEKTFDDIIRLNTWASDRAEIAIERLAQPVRKGGRGMVYIKVRNTAISVIDVQTYLAMEKEGPEWPFFIDDLFRRAWDQDLYESDDDPRINPFIQNLPQPKNKGNLPKMAKKILSTIERMNIKINVDEVDENLKLEIPIWWHPGIMKGKRIPAKAKPNCHLRNAHGVRTVGQANMLAAQETHHNHDPNDTRTQCGACTELKNSTGCRYPLKCIINARKILDKLEPKWRPGETRQEAADEWVKEMSEKAKEAKSHTYIFKKTRLAKKKGDLFRALTKEQPKQASEPGEKRTRSDIEIVYTDGGCINNGTNDARAGSGIFFGDNDDRNSSFRLPTKIQSNQAAEIYAIIKAAELADPEKHLHIKSDSMYAIEGLTINLEKHEDAGWLKVSNKDLFIEATDKLRRRKGETVLEWVKGHANERGNEEADRLASEGIRKEKEYTVKNFHPGRVTGARLNTTTQSMIYHSLIKKLKHKETKRERTNLDRIQEDYKAVSEKVPTRENIWLNLKQTKIIDQVTREFLFKAIKGSHKVGRFWVHIPNFEHRAICEHCGTTESLEHILTQCQIPGQNETWELAKNIWEMKYDDWNKPTFGEIIGCASRSFRNNKGRVAQGKTRLYQILVSTTSYTIWTTRCRRVIENENLRTKWPNRNLIKKTLEFKLNTRIRLDCLHTNEKRFGKRALKDRQVESTWSGLIHEEENKPPDWYEQTRGFSGYTPKI